MAAETDWSKVITVPVREGNRIRYLIDGPAAFQAMHAAILTTLPYTDGSGYYIYLLGWWLDDLIPLTGAPGTSIAALFRQASLRKVQIRVMLWDQALPPTKNTPEITRINALPTGSGILDNNTLYTVGSHHQKLLVVKGQLGLIGFCGGVDINRDRIETVPDQLGSPLHDIHCQIEGSAANDLVEVFVQRWLAHPEHVQLDKAKGELSGLSDCVIPTSKKPPGNQYIGIARTFNFVGSGRKCAKEHSVRSTMLAAIGAAKRFIYIEDQYLVCQAAAQALSKALSHLQHVTIVIPASPITEPGLPHCWEKRAAFMATLTKGMSADEANRKVRVFYRVTPGSESFGPRTYIHAKTWIFDDELAVIGSANCNERGWSSDSEVIAAIFDSKPSTKKPSFAQQLRMDLWAANLGLKNKLAVADGVESSKQWLKLPATAIVRRYDPQGGKDSLHTYLSWDSYVDPSAENLSQCGSLSTVAK